MYIRLTRGTRNLWESKDVRGPPNLVDVQQALEQVRTRAMELETWYLDACESAYGEFCRHVLAALPVHAHTLPTATNACCAWLQTRHAVLNELGLGDASPAFVLRCQTQFILAMQAPMLETLPVYFAQVLREEHGSIITDPTGIQVAGQLRILGLATFVQGVLTSAATQLLQQAVWRATGANGERAAAFDQAAFPAVHDLLQDQLVPALAALLEAFPDLVGSSDAGRVAFREVWDVSQSHLPDTSLPVTPISLDHASLYLRLEYSLSKALGEVRYVDATHQTCPTLRHCQVVPPQPCVAARFDGVAEQVGCTYACGTHLFRGVGRCTYPDSKHGCCTPA